MLEDRKHRALFSEMRIMKNIVLSKKESDKVKDESKKNRDFLQQQFKVELEEKRSKVGSILSNKGRGYQLKLRKEKDVQKEVADHEETQYMTNANKLERAAKRMMTLEEIEKQMVDKLQHTQ